MIYNLKIANDLNKFEFKVKSVIERQGRVDLTEPRSVKQNSSVHLFCEFVSVELNELGMEFRYFGLKGSVMSTRYTMLIVKEHFWKPLQMTLFGIKSTTKIDTNQINEIVDILTKFFADKGVLIEFPSEESKNNKK